MATRKTKTEEVKPVESKPAVKKPTAKKTPPAKKPLPRFCAVRADLYHPFKDIWITTAPAGVEIDGVDSWLESQIHGGLVKEL